MKYILRLSTQSECYASDGLCQRTTRKSSAKRFATASAARIRLTMERKHRTWPNARVLEVPE